MLPRVPAAAADTAAAAGHPETTMASPVSLGWLRILGAAAGRAVLTLVVTMALWSSAPALLGWQPTTVVSGSMEPSISVGDVVVARPVGTDNFAIGRVVLVDDPDHPERLRLHRIAAVNPDGSLTLRGDANAANDSTAVWPSAVHGVGYLRIPAVGLPITWAKSGQWLELAALAAALAGAVALTRLDKPFLQSNYRKEDNTENGSTTEASTTCAMSTVRPAGRAAVAVLLLKTAATALAGASLLAAPTAHAAFSRTTTNWTNTFASRPYFSCTAAVLDDSPSLFFAFNDTPGTSTTVTDSSGNSKNGAIQGTASLSTDVPCTGDGGKSANLAGNGYILTGGTATTLPDVFSYEMWFKTSSTAGGKLGGFENKQVGTSTTSDRNVYMRADGKLVFGVAPGGSMRTIASTLAYNDGNWHHIAVTLSSAGMKLYVDGTNVATEAGTTTALAGYTGWVRFGNGTLRNWPEAGASDFNGQIDNIAVYTTTALTPEQVLAHYQAGLP